MNSLGRRIAVACALTVACVACKGVDRTDASPQPPVAPSSSSAPTSPPASASTLGPPAAPSASTAAATDGGCHVPVFNENVGTVSPHPQSLEGRVILVTGLDPEQGQGSFPVLRLDTPLCSGETTKGRQSEVELMVMGERPAIEAFGKKWAGKHVRVKGDLRTLEMYAHPIRPTLMYATHVEEL